MEKPNFRRTPVTPPADKEATIVHVSQPLPSYKVVLTDQTRKNLRVIGWQEGDPVPAELGQRLQEMQDAMRASDAATEQSILSQARNIRPKQVNFEDLPPEKQAELSSLIAEAKSVFSQQQAEEQADQEMEQELRGVPPQAREATREAIVARKQWELQQQARKSPGTMQQLPDFRRKTAEAAGPVAEIRFKQRVPDGLPEPPPGGTAHVDGIEPVFTNPESLDKPATAQVTTQVTTQVTPEVAPEVAPEVEESATGATAPLHQCPRCFYNLSLDFTAEPTAEEKEQFVLVVSGVLDRFRKQYELMDGRVTLAFRSLTTPEVFLVEQQMAYDILANRIRGMGDYLAYLLDYRLALGLEKILVNKRPTKVNPQIKEVGYDEEPGKNETVLVPFTKWFRENVLPTESIRHMAMTNFRHFQDLVEGLEGMAQNPDFWKGIGPQP